jgi:hypothetical protein
MFDILLNIPNPWELILQGIKWLANNLKPILPLLGVFAALLIAYFLARFVRFVKLVLGNIFTPTGGFFFIMALIALAYFLITYKLI